SGNYLWGKGVGGTGSDQCWGVAVDAVGNVYITGFYFGSGNFNPGGIGGDLTSAGGNDVFVAKYDVDGDYVWARSMGGASADIGYTIAVDVNTGSVYVAGAFSDTIHTNSG